MRIVVECLELEAPVDVEIDPRQTIGDLAQILVRYGGLRQVTSIAVQTADGELRNLNPESTIERSGLVAGDTIVINPATSEGTGSGQRFGELCLAVAAGVDSGRLIDLTPGDFTVGRHPSQTLVLSDPQVSRRDFALKVDTGENVVLDPGTERSNPVRVNGEVVDESTQMGEGDVIHVGATTFVVRRTRPGWRRSTDYFETVPFQRTPYLFQPVPERVFEPLGRVPTKPQPRRFQFLTVLAPLGGGVGMAAMTGRWQFLLFTLMSPIVAVANHFEGKRAGGNEYEKKLAELRDRIEQRNTELQQALQTERDVRNRNSPDMLELLDRAESHDKHLWERSRTSSIFLQLRFGIGDIKPNVEIKPETSGEDELCDEVNEAAERHGTLVDVPVTVDLADKPITALVGTPNDTVLLANALALQAATLHSPEDLVIASAVSHEHDINEWLKWLPHVQSTNSPIAGPHLTGDPEAANTLLQAIGKIAEQRTNTKDQQLDLRWPRILVFIEQKLGLDAGTTSKLFEQAHAAGVSVVWLTEDERYLPRQAESIATLTPLEAGDYSTLTYVDSTVDNQQFEPSRLTTEVTERAAKALAPLRDVTAANPAASLPSLVTLYQSLGVDTADTGWIAQQWLIDRGYSLPAPVGLNDAGPVTLDLIKHGPHSLIGGTTGAGKSELVQTLVANLIALNSPERLNFLFIDYKGGALSDLFANVPHSVGSVTNLNVIKALRALTSLKAELDRRMKLINSYKDVADLKDLLKVDPVNAPASLVIVIDEYQALAAELPDFVKEIVSVAARGRSLGIHLLLATQSPSSIDENIRRNTTLRLSLRVLDSGESKNVIDAPDAALLPAHMKGRGFARLGPGELVAFQSGWSTAPIQTEQGLPPITISPFTTLPLDQLPASQRATITSSETTTTETTGKKQLTALMEAVEQAAQQTNMKRGRQPWRDELPDLIALRELLEEPRSIQQDVAGVNVTVGLVDDPQAQDQYPQVFDLADSGGLVIYGNGGSGKTTALKTVASSAAIRDSQNDVQALTIIGLDFASQELGTLTGLPQCDHIVSGENVEAVTRTIALLNQIFADRQAATAEAVSQGETPKPPTPILLLIDGYDNLVEAFTASGQANKMQLWLERIQQVINRGRQVSIYPVLTTSSVSGASGRLMNVISNRIVLRQTEDTAYRTFGVPTDVAKGLQLEPGQAITRNADLVQIAAVCLQGDSHAGCDPNAVAELGETLQGNPSSECATQPLPTAIPVDCSQLANQYGAFIGLADLNLNPVYVDIEISSFLVIGPPRSGRSNALAVVAQQLAAKGKEVWVVGPHGSLLQDFETTWTQSIFGKAADITQLLQELVTAAESFPNNERILVFDDVNRVDDMSLNPTLKKIIEADVRCIGSTTRHNTLMTSNPVQKELKEARQVLVLKAEDQTGIQNYTGKAHSLRPGLKMVDGRGVLINNGIPTTIQTAVA